MTQGLGRVKKAAKRKNPGINKHKLHIVSLIDQIIREADIILEVIDARFIEKSRNREIEEKVKKLNKVLIYVLNKSDLIDVNWLRQNMELEEIKPYLFFSSKKRRGASMLRKIIKINANQLGKDSVKIGVIGYPNSGKSSIINYLIGKSSTKTSSEAGYTKGIQKLKLSEGIYLIDTPGIIPSGEKIESAEINKAKLFKADVKTWERIKNPDMAAFRLINQNPEIFENYYKIDAENNPEILIDKLGRKLNYLKKGNLVDESRTAKKILQDWQEGKIRGDGVNFA